MYETESRFPTASSCGNAWPSQHLIDDDNSLGVQAIMVVEESASAQRDTHHFEIIRRYARCQGDRHFVGRGRCRRGPVAESVVSFAHGNNVGQSNGLDSGNPARTIQHALLGRAHLLGCLKRARCKSHVSDEHIVNVDARING